MIQIPIENIPNQAFSLQIDNNTYDLAIKTCNAGSAQIMAIDITINNEMIVQSQRAVSGYPIIPYTYKYNGNFVLVTNNDDLPDYRQFQTSQFLIYSSQDEIRRIFSGGN